MLHFIQKVKLVKFRTYSLEVFKIMISYIFNLLLLGKFIPITSWEPVLR